MGSIENNPFELPHDQRWAAVDKYTISHLIPETMPYHKATAQALSNNAKHGLPEIDAPLCQAKMMAIQCRAAGVTHALEVGTLGGCTAIWLAKLNPDIHVTTVEYDQEHANVARENFQNAGVEKQIEMIVGAGMDVLPKLLNEVRSGSRQRYGLTFIDADKVNNYNYFDLAVQMSRKNALVYVDNVVFDGAIISEDPERRNVPKVVAARNVIEAVGRDERVEAVVMQCVAEKGYDGYIMAIVM